MGLSDDFSFKSQVCHKSSYDTYLNDLVPWCGVGCVSFFCYTQLPECLGFKVAGDICCCTGEIDMCRVMCGDSNEDLKMEPENCFRFCHSVLDCGACKTLCLSQVNCCCCEMRLGIPTKEDSSPFIVNILGLNFMYGLNFVFGCWETVKDLKAKGEGTEERSTS